MHAYKRILLHQRLAWSGIASFLRSINSFMSDPARDLQNLNLDDMPVTRSHARAPLRGQGRARGEEGSALSHASQREPTFRQSSMSGPSGTRSPKPQYASQAALSATSPSAVAAASAFHVDKITHHGTHIDFHLSAVDSPRTRTTVALHGVPGRRQRARCSFAGHGSDEEPCFHISWLISSLFKVLQNPPVILQTDRSTIQAQVADILPLISQEIEESLRNRLNPFRRSRVQDESDDGGQYLAIDLDLRRDTLADILTAFDNNELPEDFRQKARRDAIVSDAPACFVKNNLQATIYRLAMLDQHVFDALQQILPIESRAAIYLKKQDRIAKQSFHGLHHYSQTGAVTPHTPTSVPAFGEVLRRIVHQVYEDWEMRLRSGLSAAAGQKLAEFLVTLVGEIVARRNLDFFEHIRWHRIVPPNEQARDRNIFRYLISDPPELDSDAEHWMKDLFVIDRFGNIPKSQWSYLLEKWRDIKNNIDESAREGASNAESYVARIDEIIR